MEEEENSSQQSYFLLSPADKRPVRPAAAFEAPEEAAGVCPLAQVNTHVARQQHAAMFIIRPSFSPACHTPPSRGGRRSETLIALYGVHDKESTLVQPITGKNTNPDEGGLSAASDT